MLLNGSELSGNPTDSIETIMQYTRLVTDQGVIYPSFISDADTWVERISQSTPSLPAEIKQMTIDAGDDGTEVVAHHYGLVEVDISEAEIDGLLLNLKQHLRFVNNQPMLVLSDVEDGDDVDKFSTVWINGDEGIHKVKVKCSDVTMGVTLGMSEHLDYVSDMIILGTPVEYSQEALTAHAVYNQTLTELRGVFSEALAEAAKEPGFTDSEAEAHRNITDAVCSYLDLLEVNYNEEVEGDWCLPKSQIWKTAVYQQPLEEFINEQSVEVKQFVSPVGFNADYRKAFLRVIDNPSQFFWGLSNELYQPLIIKMTNQATGSNIWQQSTFTE